MTDIAMLVYVYGVNYITSQGYGWLRLWLAMAMDVWPGAVTVSLARHTCDGNTVTDIAVTL